MSGVGPYDTLDCINHRRVISLRHGDNSIFFMEMRQCRQTALKGFKRVNRIENHLGCNLVIQSPSFQYADIPVEAVGVPTSLPHGFK